VHVADSLGIRTVDCLCTKFHKLTPSTKMLVLWPNYLQYCFVFLLQRAYFSVELMPHNFIFVAQLGRLHCITYATLRVCVLKVSLGTSLCRCIVKNGHLDTVSLALVCSVVHQQWTPCTHIGKVLYLDISSCRGDGLARFCQSSAVSGMAPLMIHSPATATTSVMPCVKGLVSQSFHVRPFSYWFWYFICHLELLVRAS